MDTKFKVGDRIRLAPSRVLSHYDPEHKSYGVFEHTILTITRIDDGYCYYILPLYYGRENTRNIEGASEFNECILVKKPILVVYLNKNRED